MCPTMSLWRSLWRRLAPATTNRVEGAAVAARVDECVDQERAISRSSLDQGLVIERRIFQILAASEDKSEGMAAFVEKREGQWKGR